MLSGGSIPVRTASIAYHQVALDIATHAGYSFFIAFLQKHCPDDNVEKIAKAKEMIKAAGLDPSLL